MGAGAGAGTAPPPAQDPLPTPSTTMAGPSIDVPPSEEPGVSEEIPAPLFTPPSQDRQPSPPKVVTSSPPTIAISAPPPTRNQEPTRPDSVLDSLRSRNVWEEAKADLAKRNKVEELLAAIQRQDEEDQEMENRTRGPYENVELSPIE